jgi:hypothetical protein
VPRSVAFGWDMKGLCMAKEAKPAPTRAGAALLDQLDHDPDAKRKFAVFCGKVAAAGAALSKATSAGKKVQFDPSGPWESLRHELARLEAEWSAKYGDAYSDDVDKLLEQAVQARIAVDESSVINAKRHWKVIEGFLRGAALGRR